MAPSPTIRRLLRETAELSTSTANPNPAFHASPVSDADLHEWHFTILGPPAPSPYAGGMYHGRITLPPAYPLKPPNFRFLTPSGRFEVNREICLSISGFHEETWMPAWGVRTALTALRSFMAEAGSAGQVGGLEASDLVRKRLAKESRAWRCDVCQKSNEQGMREWWESCARHGVKVEGDEEVSLEALPEGMNLEERLRSPLPEQLKSPVPEKTSARIQGSKVAQGSKSAEIHGLGIPLPTSVSQMSQSFPASTSALSSPRIDPPSQLSPASPNPTSRIPSSPQTQTATAQTPCINFKSSLSPQISSTSPHAESQSSRHDDRAGASNLSQRTQQPTNTNQSQTPINTPYSPNTIPGSTPSNSTAAASTSKFISTQVQPPPTSIPSNQAQKPLTPNPTSRSSSSQAQSRRTFNPNQPTIQSIQPNPRPILNSNINTIDRAIAFVFLALCLMVLKKTFYPAGSSWEVDEYYLKRA